MRGVAYGRRAAFCFTRSGHTAVDTPGLRFDVFFLQLARVGLGDAIGLGGFVDGHDEYRSVLNTAVLV